MLFWMITTIIIILIVLVLSVITISTGYQYKHTVDPIVSDDEKKYPSDVN
ncbi:YtzI protein [Bacillaceae bacterium SIJ1]|nr:YtzI protein [Litoribacterium kuwaitense]NGP44235.1 YtzI protein [Litoribacterium kuwaitense]